MLRKLAVGYEKFLFVVRAGDLVGAHSLVLILLSHQLLLLACLLERNKQLFFPVYVMVML